MKSLSEWLKASRHLPSFIRDFHDAKNVFKAVHSEYRDNESTQAVTWVDAHCYVIDCFLFFMAAHGWTLQRSQANRKFMDLDETLNRAADERVAVLRSVMKTPPQTEGREGDV